MGFCGERGPGIPAALREARRNCSSDRACRQDAESCKPRASFPVNKCKPVWQTSNEAFTGRPSLAEAVTAATAEIKPRDCAVNCLNQAIARLDHGECDRDVSPNMEISYHDAQGTISKTVPPF
jgi:hypothetical protein